MTRPLPTILLASASPRRRELLSQAGIPFLGLPKGSPGVDETPLPQETPEHYVERLAISKARMGWQVLKDSGLDADVVLGADTTVSIDHHILEKPQDDEDARRMLRLLSGRPHRVMTALCLKNDTEELSTVQISTVTFKKLSDLEIDHYVASREPFDKAGGYGIQGRAALFIETLEGSYSGVMGLPLYELGQLLSQLTDHG